MVNGTFKIYASSPGYRVYCYAEIAIFFADDGHKTTTSTNCTCLSELVWMGGEVPSEYTCK